MPANKKSMLKPKETAQPNPQHWVFLYADYLFGFALMRLNDKDLAKDLVQETFLAALEKIDQFKGNSSEKTWLTAILKNKVIDVYRKNSSGFTQKSSVKEAEQDQADFFEPADGQWNQLYWPKEFGIEDQEPLLNKKFNQILQKCMQKLPALWLAVFAMKHMDDEPTNEICSRLKVSSSNFGVIIHRTKLNLRACLSKNWI